MRALTLALILTRHEMVHPPGTPSVGLCKGQHVFARSSVHKLLTAERWFREGRELKPDLTLTQP